MNFNAGNKKFLEFKICNPLVGKTIPLPSYSSEGSAGLDLRACTAETELALKPGATCLIPTGIAIHLKDPNYAGVIVPRSGLGHRHGIVLGNLVGLIDSDYQKELMVSLWNRSEHTYHMLQGERIAQLVIVPIQLVELVQVREFETIETPHGGFGKSGRL